MGAIWKFKKVEYLSEQETRQQIDDYLLGDKSEKYKILLQKVGQDYRIQWIKIKPVVDHP